LRCKFVLFGESTLALQFKVGGLKTEIFSWEINIFLQERSYGFGFGLVGYKSSGPNSYKNY
jgi:hypothetical protein